MKIIVLQDYLRSGGTERHSILLARELSGLGHAATLLTFRPGGTLSATAGAAHAALQPFDTGIDWLAPGLARLFVLGALNWTPVWHRPGGGTPIAEIARQLLAPLRAAGERTP